MYRIAYSLDGNTIVYFDKSGNKHIRKGGNLSWRINNPGLVKSHSHYAKSNGSIGSCQGFAIFSYPEQGHKALSAWLHSKKYYNSTIQAIAEHYHPNNADAFAIKLSSGISAPIDKKLKSIHRYFGMKEGLSEENIIKRWALDDALLYLDSIEAHVFESFMKQRISHYESLMKKISNITILDPDPTVMLNTNSAQNAIKRKLKDSSKNTKALHLLPRLKKKKRSFCMSSCQNKVESAQNLKRKAKICATAWTIIYSLLLPLLSYFALLSAMIFDDPHLSIPKGLSIIFTISLIPLSLPVSIDLMWSSYVCEEYGKTLFFWSVPWLTLIAVLVLDPIIRFL